MDFSTGEVLISILIIITFQIYIIVKFWYNKRNSKTNNLSIRIVTNSNECKYHCSKLSKEGIEQQALGFDCEWVSEMIEGKSVQKPVSLLQLASHSGFCCLFRLNELGSIPPELKSILEDHKILKLGVNCLYDAKLIEKDYGVKVKHCLDLRHLYPRVGGLASMAKQVINVHLKKDIEIVCADWNQKILTNEQINYAAKDAWVALEIFKTWLKNNSFDKENIENLKILRYIDLPFKASKNIGQYLNEARNQNVKIERIKPKFARQTPLYDNCWMYAPDGQLLCSCDKKKAAWYVERGLAKVYFNEPYSIKLLFEPSTRPGDDTEGNFYREFKKNCCVVCGSHESYMKHYVVPKEYRKHFPKNMKSHQSHDIVLTCLYCHSNAKIYMKKLKEELGKMCNAPIYTSQTPEQKKYIKIKNICRTLLNSGKNIPDEKRKFLEDNVKNFFGIENITIEALKEICTMKEIKFQENATSHGKTVVEFFKKRDKGLVELEEMWRKYFLDNLKPQFLPSAWSVDHNHKNL